MKGNKYLEICIVILVLFFCEWFFFRNVIGTGMQISEDCDGRLTMLIAEHWYHVFRGEHRVADLGIFFPAKNTLGYSDILLVYGLIHSCIRMFGKDMFFAYKATLMLVHMIGSFSLFYLLRNRLQVAHSWAFFGTIAFSLSNTYSVHFVHTQLAALSLVPLVIIFFSLFIENQENKSMRNIFAVVTITIMCLIAYTAWYIAFFTALFVFLYVLVFCICSLKCRSAILKETQKFILKNWAEVFLWALYGIALMVPFVLLELPVMKMSGGRTWDAIIYMPEPIDLIGVSTDNLLLGKLMSKFDLASRGYAETEMGFSIVLFSLFILANILFRQKKGTLSYKEFFFKILSITIIVSMVISIRLSSNRVSLWWFVWRFFPGGSSIRAMSRFLFYLSLPMAIATSYGCDICFKRISKFYRLLGVICVILVFISNIKIYGVRASWDSSVARDSISSIAQPPEDCEVFYIINDNEKPYTHSQLDAYQIADKYGISTINGYSGLSPSGWGGIWEIDGEYYLDAVSDWIDSNGLENVYAYDYKNNAWYRH